MEYEQLVRFFAERIEEQVKKEFKEIKKQEAEIQETIAYVPGFLAMIDEAINTQTNTNPMKNNKFPEMTVEQREGKPHNVPAPDLSDLNMAKQVNQAMQLNEDAKSILIKDFLHDEVRQRTANIGWKKTTLDIIKEYIPFDVTDEEIKEATREVLQCDGFDEVAKWVRDDACSEVFNRMLKYCKREGQKEKRPKDFIDGSGIGYLKTYIKFLDKNINKTFDVKWHHKVERPLVYVLSRFGIDLRIVANWMHPGHWSYTQGHSTKSFTVLQAMRHIFHLDKDCDKMMHIAAYVFGFGRDGNFIHVPQDTGASAYNTDLEEYQK